MKPQKIIWNEGLFIHPQHFQQESLYNDYRFCNYQKTGFGDALFFGFSKLVFDQSSLMFGKIKLEQAQGILPDGTLIDIPGHSEPPDLLMVDSRSRVGETIYLCLPFNNKLTFDQETEDATTRYKESLEDIEDLYSKDSGAGKISVAKFQFRLLFESDDRSQYVCLPAARIADVREDNALLFDNEFAPSALTICACSKISAAVAEISDLLYERAQKLAQKLCDPSAQTTANVVDHLMLACMNRFYPVFFALSRNPDTGMYELYKWLAMLSGEMNTYVSESKVAEVFDAYNHLKPHEAVWPLIRNLKVQLSTVLYSKALRLNVEPQQFGVHHAPVTDSSLFDTAQFIVGLNIDAADTDLANSIKVSSMEKIQELINYQLPGIPIKMLTLAPRNIPYNPNFTYFKLDKNTKSWGQMQGSAGFALHISTTQDKLELQFWAVRGEET